ncbi:MAG: ATP-binding protein [Myxococcota bacterium]|nr:ATP-binding protein [Myxococcota bacterium]
MPNTGNRAHQRIVPRQSSVRYRVLAGLVVILIAFASLTGYSIVLHRNTVATIGLVNTVYLPLTHGTAEIKSMQLIFNTLMDRLADNPNESVTREWIDAWRRFRPSELDRLIRVVLDTLEQHIPSEETAFLFEMKDRLLDVRSRYIENESEFQKLYDLMDSGHIDDARIQIEGLKRVERDLDKVLRGIGEAVGRHITDLGEAAEQDGDRATWILSLLTLVTLIGAGAVIVSTNRLLAPLKTLEKAVARVAKGNLQTHIDLKGHDEISALATGFNRMTQALADRDQMLIRSERLATAGKMAAQVTHEIRNPLSSLGLNAELLEEELALNAEQGEKDNSEAKTLLNAMQDEIERLTGITESYLRFARLPSPEPTFDDLNDAVKTALEFMRGEISECGIAINTDLSPTLGPVLFDRGQIRQALTNLFRNACEAMQDGGILVVGTQRQGDWIELSVTDTGPGVPEDAVDHIFDAFYSTKSSGTGLGLPLVRQICLAHGGEIRYESTAEQGSRFVIALPGATKSDDETDT